MRTFGICNGHLEKIRGFCYFKVLFLEFLDLSDRKFQMKQGIQNILGAQHIGSLTACDHNLFPISSPTDAPR